MSPDTLENINYVERLLESRLDEQTFTVFRNRTQMNVDINGTDYRFYTNVASSTKARLFLYKMNGKCEDEFMLRDIVGRVDNNKNKIWSHIDNSKTYSNQVAISGIMLENIPQAIKKITEIIMKG